MIRDKVQEEKSGIINQDSRTHQHEDTVLSYIKKSLSLDDSINCEELMQLVLNPDFIGRETINLLNYRTGKNAGKRDFYAGLSYVALDNKENNRRYLSGFMLDEIGIGIIEGSETIANGVKKLEFTRRNINIAGLLSKEEDAKYTCFFPHYENTSVGWFMTSTTPTGTGSIEICPNNMVNVSRPIIQCKINEYYYKFIKDFSLESLAKGN